jgi:hypothetical protein
MHARTIILTIDFRLLYFIFQMAERFLKLFIRLFEVVIAVELGTFRTVSTRMSTATRTSRWITTAATTKRRRPTATVVLLLRLITISALEWLTSSATHAAAHHTAASSKAAYKQTMWQIRNCKNTANSSLGHYLRDASDFDAFHYAVDFDSSVSIRRLYQVPYRHENFENADLRRDDFVAAADRQRFRLEMHFVFRLQERDSANLFESRRPPSD